MVLHGVLVLTREQAVARRAELVSELGMDEDELRRRARHHEFTSQEAARYEEIEDLEYLLSAGR